MLSTFYLYNASMQYSLMNVLLSVDEFLADHTDLLYRVQGRACTLPNSATNTPVLEFEGEVDFLTYFNALPLNKWQRYTGIDHALLCLEATEGISIVLKFADAANPGPDARALVRTQTIALKECARGAARDDGFVVYEIPIPFDAADMKEAVLVSFAISSSKPACIRNARFVADVEEDRVRPTRIAIATTTFNNEDYILPNIQAIQSEVLQSNEVSDAFHVFVIDNGQTLDATKLRNAGVMVGNPDEVGRMHAPGITVCPNPNVGGSGGFARGMIEALEYDGNPFTHVLLMDDDIKVSPESFKRTFYLLRLAQGEYCDAFVNGAMLKRAEPTIQFEDVSFARSTGGYERFKPNLDVSQLDDVVRNETISVEGDNAYGAWWYSCIPTSAVRNVGLPMPFFVRGDDVEYGLRCQGTYMVMSGICVWHDHFVGRFRASVDSYQYARNLLVLSTIHEQVSFNTFMMRYWRVLRILLRSMNYDAAELWLDALEDYLRGPDWLANVDGAEVLKRNSAKNEVLVPLDQLDTDVLSQVDITRAQVGFDEPPRSALAKVLESIPHDRHWFPDLLLRDKPATIDYSGNLGPWQEVAMRKTLVALDATAEKGHIRTLDRQRYRELVQRYRTLRSVLRTRGQDISQEWKDAFPYLTSVEYWKAYLGLVGDDATDVVGQGGENE